MISYDIYLFHYYSFSGLLDMCNKLNIEVKKYYIYNDDFYLKIRRSDRKKVKDHFCDFKIVSKIGFVNFFELLISRPITLIGLVMSVLLFFNLSNRVYEIDISGDYPLIEEDLRLFLKQENIDVFHYSVDLGKIKEIERKVQEKFNDEIELVEITKKGALISLNYKKRRKVNLEEEKGNNIYASKDGVIRGFKLLSGLKEVRINDFVRKGDLLVSDVIINNDKESIDIGTKGSVYASTYYFIEVMLNDDINSVDKYVYMLDKARYEVSKNINSKEEYIEKEEVLISDLDNGYMKIYYVLYENITI